MRGIKQCCGCGSPAAKLYVKVAVILVRMLRIRSVCAKRAVDKIPAVQTVVAADCCAVNRADKPGNTSETRLGILVGFHQLQLSGHRHLAAVACPFAWLPARWLRIHVVAECPQIAAAEWLQPDDAAVDIAFAGQVNPGNAKPSFRIAASCADFVPAPLSA